MITAIETWFRKFRLTTHYHLRIADVWVCAVLASAAGLIIAASMPASVAAATFYLVFVMLLITLIDHRQFLIPDVLSLPAIPAGLLAAIFAFGQAPLATLIDHGSAALVAGCCLALIRIAYRAMRGVEGMGFGDVKLGIAAGAWVGLDALAFTCLIATCGALAAVIISGAGSAPQRTSMKTAMPFGSFIAPSIVIVWLAKLFGVFPV